MAALSLVTECCFLLHADGQVAALSLASGNGVLLKGGKEATHSNEVLHRTLCAAIERASAGRVGRGVLGLVHGRDEISALLRLHGDIDLVIPRGSNAMVQVRGPMIATDCH